MNTKESQRGQAAACANMAEEEPGELTRRQAVAYAWGAAPPPTVHPRTPPSLSRKLVFSPKFSGNKQVILYSLLFLIYVNDLTQHISDCLVVKYADDKQLIHTGNIDNIDDLMCRSAAKDYFNVNRLLLKTKETQCMFVGSRGYIWRIPTNTCLKADGSEIAQSNMLKKSWNYF